MDEQEMDSTLLTVSPEEGQVDGRSDDETDRCEEGRRLARVLMAVGDYMKGRRKRHGQ